MNILIIDSNGIKFNGNSLDVRGVGGSEAAIILLSKELNKIGFSVTVINNCKNDICVPGVYSGITYIDQSDIHLLASDYDVVLSTRSVLPFLPTSPFYSHINTAKFKAVWLHDISCTGDEQLEYALTHNYINEIFTLSDYHTNYVLNASNRRYELLKNKIFQTRNGAVKYFENDLSKKTKHFFIYNASAYKGLEPLVHDIWPEIKKRIPDARLFVTGGYYEYGDTNLKTYYEKISDNTKYHNQNIDFCGIMQPELVAKIQLECGFMLYPAATMPETFGISSLESLLYKTPIITCKFGALEETAISKACYLLDEPIPKYTDANYKSQIQKFVDLVMYAYENEYLYQQKQEYCSIVETDNIYTWKSIALQWKQHIYYMLGMFLSNDEYKKVTKINDNVARIFNRRFRNIEEIETNRYYNNIEKHISIISPVYNAEEYIERCILSVTSQDYNNYTFYIIDDNSSDKTKDIIKQYDNVVLIENDENKGSLYNQYHTIMKYCTDDDIVILLDGDDALINNNSIFKYYNELHDDYDFTYGSCWSAADNIPLIAQDYPNEVKINKTYRNHKFTWGIPYTHLRTFKKYLLNDINTDNFMRDNEWIKVSGDVPLFYTLIEQADPNRVKAVKEIFTLYNDINPINDFKADDYQSIYDIDSRFSNVNINKKILIAIPTSKYITVETFKSIYDLIVPDGYTTTFQTFFGYRIDQIRNLIANYAKDYDYLFAIDSDISFASDTLIKLLENDKDIVSGIYIQRIADKKVLELFTDTGRLEYEDIKNEQLVSVRACGFGCILIKTEVFKNMEYPHFLYRPELDHEYAYSEDVYFCDKARELGYSVWVNPTILCKHIGEIEYTIT